MVELYILLIFMILAAIVAVEVKDLLSSVIAVGAVGLALSILFIILKAPDVAITQLVVEILCLIILIRATLKKDLPFSTTGRWFLNTCIAITDCFALSLSVLIKSKYCMGGVPGSASTNQVKRKLIPPIQRWNSIGSTS